MTAIVPHSNETEHGTRYCRTCGLWRTTEEFERTFLTARQFLRMCNDCAEARKDLMLSRNANRSDRGQAQKLLMEALGGDSSQPAVPSTQAWASTILKRFGGMDKAVGQLVDDFNHIRENKPGSPAHVKFWQMLMNLFLRADEQQRSADYLTYLSDEQAQELAMSMLLQKVQQEPGLLDRLAAAQGLALLPVGDGNTLDGEITPDPVAQGQEGEHAEA